MNGPFTAPEDNILDGKGLMEGNGFVFYAAKTAVLDGKTYLCGWIGRAGLSADSGFYQWAGNVLNHQLVQHEDKSLGVCAPAPFADYFTVEKPFYAEKEEGKVKIKGSSITLSAEKGNYALADLGMRAPTMLLECDVTLDENGLAGFAFGGSENDAAWTALCLDAGRSLLHYEGYEITELATYEPMAVTRFDFSEGASYHVKLVCENEIVILYVNEQKALSSRISHSIDGAHIGVFADGCSAVFSNISVMFPAV
jgi:beta-fructofuranosidase